VAAARVDFVADELLRTPRDRRTIDVSVPEIPLSLRKTDETRTRLSQRTGVAIACFGAAVPSFVASDSCAPI
jgi:hypothetical protein